eukprot:12846588-Ditylum_brightwellii.AAC.1
MSNDMPNKVFYSFSEIYAFIEDQCMATGENNIPIGLKKLQEYGIPNSIIEVDVADGSFDWDGKFPVSKLVDHLAFLLKWTHENLSPNKRPMNFINLRDFPVAMFKCPERLLELVKGIAKIPVPYRPAGLLQEEPIGEYFADE